MSPNGSDSLTILLNSFLESFESQLGAFKVLATLSLDSAISLWSFFSLPILPLDMTDNLGGLPVLALRIPPFYFFSFQNLDFLAFFRAKSPPRS